MLFSAAPVFVLPPFYVKSFFGFDMNVHFAPFNFAADRFFNLMRDLVGFIYG
jgi:hypothetical protein